MRTSITMPATCSAVGWSLAGANPGRVTGRDLKVAPSSWGASSTRNYSETCSVSCSTVVTYQGVEGEVPDWFVMVSNLMNERTKLKVLGVDK